MEYTVGGKDDDANKIECDEEYCTFKIANTTTDVTYNDGKWHGWNGGECPVHPESVVDITYVDGTVFTSVISRRYDWYNNLMFRVAKEHKEPREFWIDIMDMTVTTEPCHANSYYIKVKEVTE